MMYVNKRNGKMVELISQDDKFKTVMLQEVETGKAFTATTSTFKRWYKKMEQQAVEEVATEEVVAAENTEIVNNVEEEVRETPVDETPVEEEVVIEKPAGKIRTKKEMLPEIKALHEYVLHTCEELGGTVWTPSKDMKFRGLKVGKNNFIKYNWSNKSVTLFVRSRSLGLEEPITPVNHTFNDRYTFKQDTPENRKEIYRIMKTAYDWQLCKNLAKTKEVAAAE